jgi:hypothetical protein
MTVKEPKPIAPPGKRNLTNVSGTADAPRDVFGTCGEPAVL